MGDQDNIPTLELKDGGWDIAQICIQGHLVSEGVGAFPEHRQAYCRSCGSGTVWSCGSCDEAIRGALMLGVGVSQYKVPGHCHGCGSPYPWTATRVEAMRELAHELDGLSSEEQEQLAESFEELMTDTPRMELMATRFNRLIKQSAGAGRKALVSLAVTAFTEKAKEFIGLGKQ